MNDINDDVTARAYEKLKREMIAKADERHVEEDMFVGENLEGRREPKTKRNRNQMRVEKVEKVAEVLQDYKKKGQKKIELRS